MIESIQFSNIASFGDYLQELNNLKKVNYIYGANGSGKTTISRIIAQEGGFNGKARIKWANGQALHTIVYNRDFVDKMLRSDINGIFTLGEVDGQTEQELSEKRKDQKLTIEKLRTLTIQRKNDEPAVKRLEGWLTDKCWELKLKFDNYFEHVFSGYRGSKDKFKTKVLDFSSRTHDAVPLEDLTKQVKSIYSESREELPLITIGLDRSIYDVSHTQLLSKEIFANGSSELERLIEELKNSDWIKNGLQYLKTSHGKCPFCQQDLLTGMKEQIEAIFDSSYKSQIYAISILKEKYERAFSQLSDLKSSVEALEKIFDVSEFLNVINTLEHFLGESVQLINRKLTTPSTSIELNSGGDLVFAVYRETESLNHHIAKYNSDIKDIKTAKARLEGCVWAFIFNELSDDYNHYTSEITAIRKKADGMRVSEDKQKKYLETLNNEIKQLEKRSSGIVATIAKINDYLKSVGFNSFTIAETDTKRHYKLVRDNGESAVGTLSEGEKTFISFLYFMNLLDGSEEDSGIAKESVVAIDDPISSLDSDILFIVSGLIREKVKALRSGHSGVRQIFIMTHNIYFHKEVTFDTRRKKNQLLSDETFWLIKKEDKKSRIYECERNPVSSTYEMLWDEIRNENPNQITIQNTMRRIIENFEKFTGHLDRKAICDTMPIEKRALCDSLFSWVNDGSHSTIDDISHYQSGISITTYLEVFKDIFIWSGYKSHYDHMMNVVPSRDIQAPS